MFKERFEKYARTGPLVVNSIVTFRRCCARVVSEREIYLLGDLGLTSTNCQTYMAHTIRLAVPEKYRIGGKVLGNSSRAGFLLPRFHSSTLEIQAFYYGYLSHLYTVTTDAYPSKQKSWKTSFPKKSAFLSLLEQPACEQIDDATAL